MNKDDLPLLGQWMIYKGRHFRVIWSEEDQEYVGLCAEFEFMSYLDPDYTEAFVGIMNLIDDVLDDIDIDTH